MGKAMEVITGIRTAGGADTEPVNITYPSGDTNAVRAFDQPSGAWFVNMWGTATVEAKTQIKSPRFHDNVVGLRGVLPAAAQPRGMLTEKEVQKLYTTDVITAQIQAGAAETDGLAWCNYYEDLGGSEARFATIDELTPRIVNLFTVQVTCPAGAAVGVYSTNTAINATFDQFKANTDYAFFGYECDITGITLGLLGPDTGNYRIGGPMTTERMETRDWFIRLGQKLGKPCIPIINSQNKQSTYVSTAQAVVGLASDVILVGAELSR
jgi:hypothetical protein